MYKIIIIGAGQLGSRHLQAIAKSNIKISIEVVEPHMSSRVVAKERFEEIPNSSNVKNIRFLESIKELSDILDIVVVATNADVRSDVLKELLTTKKVKNLILEKVLFQTEKEYFDIEILLKNTNTKCWVNHPRRMFPFYKKLKNKLKNSESINFSVSGGNWGLACNGLHFLDLFECLSNNSNTIIDNKYLDNKVLETKRKGFIELSGKLIGSIETSLFEINNFINQSPVQFSITSDKLNILIDETNGWYKISEKLSEWKSEIKEEKIIYFQSELTNILLEDILLKNSCVLPTYSESMNLHLKFIKSLLEHINSFSEVKTNRLQIT